MNSVRKQIILDYAKWTALSALRSGAPIKSREDVYPILDAVSFAEVLQSEHLISEVEFEDWHSSQTLALSAKESRLLTGWAVKLINVYLKTAAYVGDLGRPGLRELLHPPIDGGLWKGFKKRFPDRPDITGEVCCVDWIKEIDKYATYQRIIAGCRKAARELNCSLIEVEQLWLGTVTPNPAPRRNQHVQFPIYSGRES